MVDELEARVDAAFGEFKGDEEGGAERVKSYGEKLRIMREQVSRFDHDTHLQIEAGAFIALLDFIEALEEKVTALEIVQKDMPHGLALFRRGEGGDDRGVEVIPLGALGVDGDNQIRLEHVENLSPSPPGNQSPRDRFSQDYSSTEFAPEYLQPPLEGVAPHFPGGQPPHIPPMPRVENENGVPIDGGGLLVPPEISNTLRGLADRISRFGGVIRGERTRVELSPETGVDPAEAGADRTIVSDPGFGRPISPGVQPGSGGQAGISPPLDADLEIMRNAIQEEIARLPDSVEDEEERDREVLFFVFDVTNGWNSPGFLSVILGSEQDVSYGRLGGSLEVSQLKEANRCEDGSLPILMAFVVSMSGESLISL